MRATVLQVGTSAFMCIYYRVYRTLNMTVIIVQQLYYCIQQSNAVHAYRHVTTDVQLHEELA
jgi:hypothetical protein